MKKTIIVGMVALLLVFGLVLTGCGDNSNPVSPASEPEDKTVLIGPFNAVLVEDSKLTQTVYAMCYAESKFVASDSSSAISYSKDDGETWELATDKVFSSSETIYSLAYGNGTFVAVGSSGHMAYSKGDITKWTDITSVTVDLWKQTDRSGEPGFDEWNYAARIVIFAGGQFVAAGDNGVILYSKDGETWDRVKDYPFGTERIEALAYGAGKYVAGGYHGLGFATSSDGINWKSLDKVDVGEKSEARGIVYANGKFVAAVPGGKNALLSSDDGIVWKPVDTSPLEGKVTINGTEYNTAENGGEIFLDIVAGNNSFLAVGYLQVNIVGSTDGITWANVGTTTYKREEIRSLAYGNGKFLFAGEGGKINRLVEK